MHLILLHGQEPALKAAQIPIPEGVSPAEASDAGDVYIENTIYIYIWKICQHSHKKSLRCTW